MLAKQLSVTRMPMYLLKYILPLSAPHPRATNKTLEGGGMGVAKREGDFDLKPRGRGTPFSLWALGLGCYSDI